MESDIGRVLQLWIDLTGSDPERKYFTTDTADVWVTNKDLQESLVLDPSGITSLFLLQYFVERYLKNKTFTADEILEDYEALTTYLNNCKEIKNLLYSTAIIDMQEIFVKDMLASLEHYNITNESTIEMAKDPVNLAFLRRDALKAMEELDLHQFLQGVKDENPIPKYNDKVFVFWNMNSLIKTMCAHPESGISLNYIKTHDEMESYFAFVFRNGGTLSVMTDRPKYSHPMQKHISRRPGRDLGNRICQHHFPYEIIDFKWDYRGDAYISRKGETGLVSYQKIAYPIKTFNELEPATALWIIMMFQLISDKFWKKDFKTEELSYTGEMMRIGGALSDSDEVKSLQVQDYRTIEAPKLTSEDTTTDKLVEDWQYKPTECNRWLEDTYGPDVDEELLNSFHESLGEKQEFVTNKSLDLQVKEANAWLPWTKENIKHYGLQYLEPTVFGTKDKLLADQRWVARYNKAKLIERAADLHFEATKEKVLKWYEKAVVKNLPLLLRFIAEGKFRTSDFVHAADFKIGKRKTAERNIVFFSLKSDKAYNFYQSREGNVVLYDNWDYDRGPMCYLNGKEASINVTFKPTTPEALTKICGVIKTDLPEPLQHWYKDTPYGGNSILNRLDPMDWAITNPWSRLELKVAIYLSISSYNKLRRDNKLPSNKFWLKKED